MANTWNYILDNEGKLAPLGSTGELCLAGAQIAKGYWKQEERTKNAFVKNPYATGEQDAMMYRTGDLARWNEDGDLEYMGRIDDQVKLRGFRIELGEVESAIVSFGADAAVVLVQKDMLVAYYVSEKEIDERSWPGRWA